MQRTGRPALSRRHLLAGGTALGVGAALAGGRGRVAPALAAGRTLTIADVGVGDPGGDWSRFEQPTGNKVNLVSIGNAPSAVLNQLIAGGGTSAFDVINIVGGMQKPLVDNDLILELDRSQLPNWQGNSYIEQYLAPGTPGFEFIGYDEKIYGVPTVLQGDSFAYLPEKTGDARFLRRALRPEVQGLRRARGQLHHGRAKDRAVPQALRPGPDRRPGRHDARGDQGRRRLPDRAARRPASSGSCGRASSRR